MEEASIAAHLGSYTAIVRDMAVLRELIQTSTHIIGQAFDAKEDVQTLVDDAEKRIFSLAERRLEGSALPVGKILKNTFEYIERLYERKEHVTGVATGFEKLDLETSGLQPSDFIIIAGRPSMGKAQPLDALVKTATGWKAMGELRPGDALASVDGRASFVRGVFPQGARQVYRVTFSDGRSTECCAEHLWRVHHRAWLEPRVLTTEQVTLLLARKHYRHGLWVDTPSGDDGHSDPLPVDPWLLGALLGAGELSGRALRFWTSDPEIVARVAERADGQAASTVIDAMRRLRLWDIESAQRFVPDIYMGARRGARVDLLRGLLDAAGVVEARGTLRVSASSGRLARGVAALVRSLGGWCSVRRSSPRAPYVCTIDYAEPKELVTLSSKLIRTLAPRRPRRAGGAREGAPDEGRARPGSVGDRLPAADARARRARQPATGDLGDLTLAQGAREGAQRAGGRALSALARGGGARTARLPAAALRPERMRDRRYARAASGWPPRGHPGSRRLSARSALDVAAGQDRDCEE